MDTLFDLPGPEPEQAVIAHYRLSDDQYGAPAERGAIYNAERAMIAAVKAAGVGEADWNEFGGGEAVLYAYGADSEVSSRSWNRPYVACPSGRLTLCCGGSPTNRSPEWTCDAVQQQSTATTAAPLRGPCPHRATDQKFTPRAVSASVAPAGSC